jgi:predicted CxxxxCH...CXXCH cytochrome family protein
MKIVAPELHVDGMIQQSTGECSSCHGGAESAAPPFDTRGKSDETGIGVGAHRAHLSGGAFSRPLVCSECHDVPARDAIPAHVGPLPAEVRLLGVAETDRRAPAWSHASASCTDSWCHGPGPGGRSTSPSWISATSLDCTSCHGLPPPAPHPASDRCSSCHGEVIAPDDRTIASRASHVDGLVDVSVNESCTSCHGDENPAPPRDLAGNTDTSAPGVGAHQIHLAGTERSRAVTCNECHLVPDHVLAAGHLDSSRPAEVSFAGVALAFGDDASYANGACSNVSCHGAVFPEGHASGGTDTAPSWLDVTGLGATCGSCHGLPPPAPHPRGDLNPTCSACHENIDSDNLTFTRPELHVDGIVTFTLP